MIADVDVVATCRLRDFNRSNLARLSQRVFDAVRFDIEIADRFGKPVRSREWFLTSLSVIDEVISGIGHGSIVGMVYDPKLATLCPERSHRQPLTQHGYPLKQCSLCQLGADRSGFCRVSIGVLIS